MRVDGNVSGMLVALAAAVALSVTSAGASGNPVAFQYAEGQSAPRSEVRDPCILREGGTYYLTFTMWPFRNREEARLGEPNQGGSPGIALYSSKDLATWIFVSWLEKIGATYCLFFAEIFRDEKQPAFLGYRTGVAYADSLQGPWKKDPRGHVFFGGHLAVFDGPDGGKWFSYRWEKDARVRGRLCVDPLALGADGRVQARESLGSAIE